MYVLISTLLRVLIDRPTVCLHPPPPTLGVFVVAGAGLPFPIIHSSRYTISLSAPAASLPAELRKFKSLTQRNDFHFFHVPSKRSKGTLRPGKSIWGHFCTPMNVKGSMNYALKQIPGSDKFRVVIHHHQRHGLKGMQI